MNEQMGQPVLNNSLCPVYTADGGLGYIIKTRESERRWDRKKNMLQNVSGSDKGQKGEKKEEKEMVLLLDFTST